jgi:hypothetical protein
MPYSFAGHLIGQRATAGGFIGRVKSTRSLFSPLVAIIFDIDLIVLLNGQNDLHARNAESNLSNNVWYPGIAKIFRVQPDPNPTPCFLNIQYIFDFFIAQRQYPSIILFEPVHRLFAESFVNCVVPLSKYFLTACPSLTNRRQGC